MVVGETVFYAILSALYIALLIASVVRGYRRRALDRKLRKMFEGSTLLSPSLGPLRTPRVVASSVPPSSIVMSSQPRYDSTVSSSTPIGFAASRSFAVEPASPRPSMESSNQRCPSWLCAWRRIRPESRPVYAVYGSLFLYSLTRSITLVMAAANDEHNPGTIGWDLLMTPPSLALMMMQVALTYRWVKVVELLQSLQHETGSWRPGLVAVVSGVVVVIVYAVLAGVCLVEYQTHSYEQMSSSQWGTLLNVVVGAAYAYNGLAFVFLGVLLFFMGSLISESLQSARSKILAIALVFGLMGMLRGITLVIVYMTNENDMRHVRKSWWGPPVVLLMEWICIACVVFVLGSTHGSLGQAATPPASPVAESNDTRNQPLYDAYE